MSRIVFPLSTFPGDKSSEAAGRLINCFAEPRGIGADSQYILKRSPGAVQFASSGLSNFRGGIVVASTLYCAFTDTAVTVNSSGTVTTIGTLSGTDRVYWARNSKSATPDIVAVCAAGAFVVDSSSVTDYPDADVGAPNAVCWQDGYFFFTYGGGGVRSSAINDTAINALDFITAESKPDGLWRPIPWNGQLLLFGTQSTEVWSGNPPNDTGFPYNRLTSIPRGLINAEAIAGWEDGFSDALLFVGDDNRVYSLTGYKVDAVSPPDLDRLIEKVSTKTELKACVYKAGGHSFWELSSDTWSWVFNTNNLKWHERKAYLKPRSRLTRTVNAFNKWLSGDIYGGSILSITSTSAMEGTDPFPAIAESLPVVKFPSRVRVSRADFEIATGVGATPGTDPIVTDPSVEIAWSDNGGQTWGNPLLRKLGKQGLGGSSVTVANCGVSGPFGRRWRVSVSDPVHFGLMGGDQQAALGSK